MKKKIIGIVGTSGLPHQYGGFEQLANRLTIHLNHAFDFIVYTPMDNKTKDIKKVNGAMLKFIPFKSNGIQSIPFDICSMVHALFFCDIIFVCGVSGCLFFPFIKVLGKPIILNPDGNEWKRDKWSSLAKLFLKWSEKVGIKFSDLIVSDNAVIKDYIKSERKKDSVLIQYGGDHVIKTVLRKETKEKYNIKDNNYAFKVCRVEPENNIHLILEAFTNTPEMDILIVGNWNYSNYGKSLRLEFSSYRNIKLLDPIYDQLLLDELRSNCGIYIHGHSVGGTNPSLVEAMCLGCFIVAFDVSYNIVTTDNKALYFKDSNDLTVILRKYLADEIDIQKHKQDILKAGETLYRWKDISEKYASVFNLF